MKYRCQQRHTSTPSQTRLEKRFIHSLMPFLGTANRNSLEIASPGHGGRHGNLSLSLSHWKRLWRGFGIRIFGTKKKIIKDAGKSPRWIICHGPTNRSTRRRSCKHNGKGP